MGLLRGGSKRPNLLLFAVAFVICISLTGTFVKKGYGEALMKEVSQRRPNAPSYPVDGVNEGQQGGVTGGPPANGITGGPVTSVPGSLAPGVYGGSTNGVHGNPANGVQGGSRNGAQGGPAKGVNGGPANSLTGDSGTGVTGASGTAVKNAPKPYNPYDEPPEWEAPPMPPPRVDQYAAVITETDPSRVFNLAPVILHFAAVLGPNWPIVFVTLEENWASWVVPPALARMVDSGLVRIKFLPSDTDFPTHDSVSEFLSTTWLWEQFASYTRVLIFQADSIVCANSEHRLEDFLEYDFVGAPIRPGMGFGMNGGLSLRNPAMMLAIARDLKERVVLDSGKAGEVQFEDQWFWGKVLERGGKSPEPHIAGMFSVETLYYEKPLGYHQVLRFQQDFYDDIEQYCPEVALLGKGAHFRTGP